MDRWDLKGLAWRPHQPEILSSHVEGRAIVLDLPAGELLQDHEVHERAWITVIDGSVSVSDNTGASVDVSPGMLVQLAPQERREVKAVADSRLLLLLTPWPGPGHPGAMTLDDKAHARERAAERAG
jgi:quercetin dioxygenase-like cupin family protein